jgi:hypothetical protein
MLVIMFAATIIITGHSTSQGAACTRVEEARRLAAPAVPEMLLLTPPSLRLSDVSTSADRAPRGPRPGEPSHS